MGREFFELEFYASEYLKNFRKSMYEVITCDDNQTETAFVRITWKFNELRKYKMKLSIKYSVTQRISENSKLISQMTGVTQTLPTYWRKIL